MASIFMDMMQRIPKNSKQIHNEESNNGEVEEIFSTEENVESVSDKVEECDEVVSDKVDEHDEVIGDSRNDKTNNEERVRIQKILEEPINNVNKRSQPIITERTFSFKDSLNFFKNLSKSKEELSVLIQKYNFYNKNIF
ncbi:hypothetical protein A0H76_906 [Hepatospora eriocheir]|uniref:Uncharacterized protein n=1 Tax=Hepatospora eriocheir TaxID=1081669 RepID=A0A1X0QI00_9MICR|nr:hypothetical protein A0H76_906 [Hepatospora eriocheir]